MIPAKVPIMMILMNFSGSATNDLRLRSVTEKKKKANSPIANARP